MSHTILIVDDDDNFRSTVAALIEARGYTALQAADGEHGLSVARETPDISVILIDMLMPKLNGFDLGDALRKDGHQAALVFTSGLYKSAQMIEDAKTRLGALDYLIKPFDEAKLFAALGPVLGEDQSVSATEDVQARPMPAEGHLLAFPPLHLFWRIQREKHTGVLDLFGPNDRGRLFFHEGAALMAQTRHPRINVGVALIRQGVLSAEQYKETLAHIQERRQDMVTVLKNEGLVDDDVLRSAYKDVVPLAIADLIAKPGSFRWTETDRFMGRIPQARTAPYDVALRALRSATEAELAPHITPRATLRIAPGERWDHVVARLKNACGDDDIARAANGRATIGMLIQAARTEESRAARMRQIYLLMSTNAVIASEQPISMNRRLTPGAVQQPAAPTPQQAVRAAPRPAPRAAPARPITAPIVKEPPPPERPLSPAEKEARAKIAAKHGAMTGADHWGVLEVAKGASPAEIKKAYFALARAFHTDAYSGMQLGPAQTQLDEVFAAVSEAYAVLSDDGRRAEYEAEQQAAADGTTTDIGAIFEAESEAGKGKLLVERGELRAALARFQAAVQLHGDNLEYQLYHDYIAWRLSPSPNEGKRLLSALAEGHKEMPGILDLLIFQGVVAKEIGEEKKALRAFKAVLREKPNHAMSMREVRALSQSKEKPSGGLFGRLKR